jgi:hypothetical protein
MAGRGPQTLKKRQREQQRREKQQEKMAKRLARKRQSAEGGADEPASVEPADPIDSASQPGPIDGGTGFSL